MFYSQDILQKRGGRFAKIWLAATKISKLSRREVASVDVQKTCDEILAYIELRAVPLHKGERRPRFSLYLSALLMYGVVRIYHKNCEYLLHDVSSTLIRVKSVPTIGTFIDLQDIPKADQVTNPDLLLDGAHQDQDLHLSQLDMETLRSGHVEPFWGLNGSPTVVESPRKKRKKARQEEPVPLIANISEITLQEPPTLLVDTPLSPIQVPKDVELPLLNGQEIDLLMGAQIDEPPLQVSDLLPTSTPFSADTDSATRQRLRTQQTSMTESPSRIIQEEKEKTPERLPEPKIPQQRAVPPSPGVTQIITSPLPRRQPPRKSLELELTAVTQTKTTRRRKRQLAFADAETQIPKTKMKQNMTTGSDTCETFVLPDVKGMGVDDLLVVPGRKELRREPWISKWSRNARFRRNIPDDELAEALSPPPLVIDLGELPAPDQPQLQPDHPEIPRQEETLGHMQPPPSPVLPPLSEEKRRKGRPRMSTLEESVEELRRISESMMGTPAPEMSSVEIPRDASTSRIDDPRLVGLDESLQLDDSRQSKKDRGSARKRRTRSSIQAEEEPQAASLGPEMSATSLQTSHTSGRTLYDVVEEPRFEEQYIAVPLLQTVTEDKDRAQEDLLRSITEDIQDRDEQYTTFRQICPPQLLDRRSAAIKFTALLGLCAEGSIITKQKRSYEDIYIRLAE